MPRPLLILGAGSQARVVADTARALGRDVAGYIELSNKPERIGDQMLDLPVLGLLPDLAAIAEKQGAREAMPAIGNNAQRMELIAAAREAGLKLPVLVHPTAYVSPYANIGDGSFIAAQAVVGSLADLGEGCIVNTSASVDHDCILGDGVHIAVGTHLAGSVRVGELTTLGAGCAAVPGVSIGARTTVGAGATVTRDLPDDCTAVGTPAKPKGA